MFISYAQNFEDIMLWRALKHIEKGFYIDVGSNDPELDSVTKAFYDRGWRGINIEPVGQWYEKLLKDRPHDINLNIAAGNRKGEIELYEIPDTGLSTSCKSFAIQHKAELGFKSKKLKVPIDTLTNIIREYNCPTIHFLKIDAEGAEKAVLQGLDLKKTRPWVLLLEATRPNSTDEVYDEWEDILLTSAYSLVYADGLNRFYLADEKSELLGAFRYPPNVFDGFIRLKESKAEDHVNFLQEQLSEVTQAYNMKELELNQTQSERDLAKARIEELELELELKFHSIYKSISWRITWLLRKLKRLIK